MQNRHRIFLKQTSLRFVVAIALTFALACSPAARAEESLGDKIKQALRDPTPTPAPHRKKKKKSTASSESEKKASPTPTPDDSDSPKPKTKAKASPSPTAKPTQTPGAKEGKGGTSVAKSKHHQKASATSTPAPTPKATPSPSPTESPSPAPSAEASASATPAPPAVAPPDQKKKGAPATIPPGDIAGYEKYPPGLRKITDLGLELAGRNLQYKYGSADPASGGMDCSGFVNYVLTQSGLRDVPRDSSQQYIWARKAGTFRAVNSRSDDTFELDELRPGDLLFWTGTYSIERDPPITHAMIYLGREKGTGHRIMVGASDGRSYKGESRFGVSVFDFKIAHPPRDKDAKLTPTFIGYAHVPGLNDG